MKDIRKDLKVDVYPETERGPDIYIDFRKVSFLRRLLLCVGLVTYMLRDGCFRFVGFDLKIATRP